MTLFATENMLWAPQTQRFGTTQPCKQIISASGFKIVHRSMPEILWIPLHVLSVSWCCISALVTSRQSVYFVQDVHVPLVVYDIRNKSATLECAGSSRILPWDTVSGGSGCGCHRIPAAIIWSRSLQPRTHSKTAAAHAVSTALLCFCMRTKLEIFRPLHFFLTWNTNL